MAIWWFIAFIILVLIEFVTVDLVSIWFAFGSIAAMMCSFFVESMVIQLGVFIIVSLICLIITKPLVRKFKNGIFIPTNSDRVIGKEALVIKEIDKDKYGEVKVLGSIWTACCDEKVTEGTKVKVLAIDGVKLIVKVEEE